MNRRGHRDLQLPAVCGSGTFRVQDDDIFVTVTEPDPDLWADILPSLSPSPAKSPESSLVLLHCI